MYRITYSRIDGTVLLDYLPEIRTFGAQIFRFRSLQPGYISFTHGLTDDQVTTNVVLLYESEELYNACMAAEENDEEIQAARAGLAEFCAEHEIETVITYETI